MWHGENLGALVLRATSKAGPMALWDRLCPTGLFQPAAVFPTGLWSQKKSGLGGPLLILSVRAAC